MSELTVKAKTENVVEVTAFIEGQLEALDCPMKAQMQINIAIDELFSNIAQYAYAPGTGDATVRFDFDGESRMAKISFIDRGVPFNPLEQKAPDISASVEERGIGGLGIFMVRKIMDDVTYRREDGANVLTIHKKI